MIHLKINKFEAMTFAFQEQLPDSRKDLYFIFKKIIKKYVSIKRPFIGFITLVSKSIETLAFKYPSLSPLFLLHQLATQISFLVATTYCFPQFILANLYFFENSYQLINKVSSGSLLTEIAKQTRQVAADFFKVLSSSAAIINFVQALSLFSFLTAVQWVALKQGQMICQVLQQSLKLIGTIIAVFEVTQTQNLFLDPQRIRLFLQLNRNLINLTIALTLTITCFLQGILAPAILIGLSTTLFALQLVGTVYDELEKIS